MTSIQKPLEVNRRTLGGSQAIDPCSSAFKEQMKERTETGFYPHATKFNDFNAFSYGEMTNTWVWIG